MRVDVTASGEAGSGCTPVRGDGVSRGNIRGHGVRREMPDVNSRASPLSGVDATTSIVKA